MEVVGSAIFHRKVSHLQMLHELSSLRRTVDVLTCLYVVLGEHNLLIFSFLFLATRFCNGLIWPLTALSLFPFLMPSVFRYAPFAQRFA